MASEGRMSLGKPVQFAQREIWSNITAINGIAFHFHQRKGEKESGFWSSDQDTRWTSLGLKVLHNWNATDKGIKKHLLWCSSFCLQVPLWSLLKWPGNIFSHPLQAPDYASVSRSSGQLSLSVTLYEWLQWQTIQPFTFCKKTTTATKCFQFKYFWFSSYWFQFGISYCQP